MTLRERDAAALELMREDQARRWADAAVRDQRVGQRAPAAFFVPTLERLLPGHRPAVLRAQMRRLVAAGELTEHRTGRMVFWRLARRSDAAV